MLRDKYKDGITIDELADIHPSLYILVDVRDQTSHEYGSIPNSICIPDILEQAIEHKLDGTKTYVLYCMNGRNSISLVYELVRLGYDAIDLLNGYSGYLEKSMLFFDDSIQYKAERSIIKTYHKELMSPFLRALDRYQLIQEGDKIAVCISGGKDSMIMAKLFQEVHKFTKVKFDLVFLVMDPGYSDLNRKVIEYNAKVLGVPITIFESRIFDVVYNMEKSPCYICARMRRGHLYNKAKELGCNKIALGHHYDDVIETILMGMMYAGQIQTMMPKLKSEHFEGMELIRPMYLIREADIMKWRDYNNLHFIQCACHFTDTCSSCREDGTSNSKRMETKKLIEELKKTNPVIEKNIFKSVENINLHNIIAYKTDDGWHNFLDDYNKSNKDNS